MVGGESVSKTFLSYAGAAVAFYFGQYQIGLSLLAAGVSSEQQRRARNRARDAYNASLQDRMVMLDLRPDAPRTIALGRVRAVEGVRRRWASGDNNEKLTLIVSFAGHEIDGFETFWFNDVPLELDGDGYVTTAPFTKFDLETHTLTGTLDGSGNASVTLTSTPVSGTVTAIYSTGTGDASNQSGLTVTLDTGLDYDLSGGPAGADYVVNWQTNVGTPLARIRPYLGTDAQNVGDDLAAEYPDSGLTDTDRFAGMALAVIDLWYSDDAYPQGIPNITATFRGAKCLDPRDASTAWTENPALHAYHYARLANGWNVPDAEIRAQDFEDAADFCDTSTLFTLGADDVTLERYRCGIVLSTDADPRQNMGAIMETMAGRWGWAGGTLRMRCGRMAAPVFTMDESWIAQQVGNGGQASSQPVVRITNGVPREEKVNHVAGTCVDPDQRYQALPYPAVRDEVLIAADGAEYRLDMDQPGVNHIAHAQHLASITVREGQAPLRMEVTSNLSAYRCELFDVGEVTLARYGMADKTFEVIGWRWRPSEGVMLRLSEITDAIFEPVDTLNGRDPAPNGNLPSPWNVAQITGVAVDSDADIQPDGTALIITTVAWTPPTSQAVLVGGRIEVQVCRADNVPAAGVDWGSWIEQGGATSAQIPGLLAGIFYLFRVRAINSLGVRGKWSSQVRYQVTGDDVPPEDVTGLDWEIKPGLVRITCDPCIAADYAATELRFTETVPDYDAGDWPAGDPVPPFYFLVRGKSNEYHHPRPPNGTYYVLAKHIDNSGNYSEDPAYITVVVDDSIDGGGAGTLRLTTDRFPFFSFSNGTTHTAQAPGDALITFTARLQGIVGTAAFTAEAFDSGGGSLGTFTLGGTGNARTMSAAQFTSLGTSGSVRSVVVEATIGSASDSLTVYRQDSTTTAPRIYLSNPVASVPTDEAGEFGDYSDATTAVQVFAGLTDDTASYTFAITPDSGLTTTINGGAGPVSGTASVTVAVTDSTIDDGAVLISATGPGPLSATFRVLKNEASGPGYTAFFTPAEIRLPVLSTGAVASFADASSVFTIQKGGIDDTAQWNLDPEYINVAGNLVGQTVTITDFHDLGETGSGTSASLVNASGWARGQSLLWAGDAWLVLGYHGSSPWSTVKRGTDGIALSDINVGTAGEWEFGAYDPIEGRVILPDWQNSSSYIDSTDGGATWSAPKSFGGSSVSRSVIECGGGTWLTGGVGSTAGRKSTNGGASWSGVTFPAAPDILHYAAGRWYMADSSANWYVSSDAGATWSAALSAIQYYAQIRGVAGRAVALASGAAYAKYSEDGATWVQVTLPHSWTAGFAQVIRGVLYIVGSDSKVQYTTDGIKWVYAGGIATGTVSVLGMRGLTNDMQADSLRALETTTGNYSDTPLLSTSADTGFVTITASKPNEADIVRTLPVRKGTAAQDVYTSYAVPAMLLLPATSDGVVTSYANATITAKINKNGVDDTANWSWSYTTTYLTPSSGSSNAVTVTAMDNAQDQGTISFTATKAGQPVITGTLLVNKFKGTVPSGPLIGAAFNAITATATFIGVKFLGDGRFQTKVGSGGSYADAGQWHSVVQSGNASTYWIRVESTGHALNSGTTGSWLAMTSDREYTLSDASSGTHRTDLQVLFATSSGGANALMGYGALQLIVP